MRKFNKPSSVSFAVDTTIELDVRVEVSDYRFGTPAKLNARPEDCYPAEGSEYEIGGVYLLVTKKVDGKDRVVEIKLPNEVIDIIGNDLDELIDEEAEDAAQAGYEDYCDQEYDRQREER